MTAAADTNHIGDEVKTAIGVQDIHDVHRCQQVENNATEVCTVADKDVAGNELLYHLR